MFPLLRTLAVALLFMVSSLAGGTICSAPVALNPVGVAVPSMVNF